MKMRKATFKDLPDILALLIDDELGKTREHETVTQLDAKYIDAFQRIDTDPNQFLMVVFLNDTMVGTCHLTLMPSLTFTGSTRLQIEAVRVAGHHRGQGIGEWMIEEAINIGKQHGASIMQLTTNIKRLKAKRFYEKLGFEATHVGMKLHLV